MENINDLVAASKLAAEAEYVEIVAEEKIADTGSDFTFGPVGISEDEKIIFLISDTVYGEYSIAVKLLDDTNKSDEDIDEAIDEDMVEDMAEDIDEDTFGVEYDFLSAEKDAVPKERQEQVVEAIISFIVEQVARYVEDHKEPEQLDAVDYVNQIIV